MSEESVLENSETVQPAYDSSSKVDKFFGICLGAVLHSGRGAHKAMRICLKFFLLAYFLFACLFLILRFGVLPNVERYKPEIERYASQKIGRQVTMSELNASWHGLNPELSVRNLHIYDQSGREVLTLPQLNTRISWWSFFVFDIRFASFEVVEPTLQIKRGVNGVIEIAGFPIQSKNSSDSDAVALNWLLSQFEVSISHGHVNWDDQLNANPLLILSDVNFVLQNRWNQHQFALKAKPPEVIAAPIDIRGKFQQSVFARKAFDLSNWSGELYSDLRQADIPTIHRYFPFPIKLDKGVGNIRSWLKLDKGHLADFTADVRLLDVVGKFRQDLPVLDMAQVRGRFIASERVVKNRKYLPNLFGQSGHSLALIDFSMETRDGLVLPATTLKESFTPGENGQAEKVELYAMSLDLHSLANFAEHLPIPSDQRKILIDVAPKGLLKEFTAKWQGNYPELSSYSIKGRFSNLVMQPQKAQLAQPKIGKVAGRAAVPAIPGFDNLSGTIDANDKGGSFTLDSTDLSLQLPTYFLDPVMPFSRLQMQARWEFQADDRLLFQVKRMDFEQDGASASFSGQHMISMRHQDLGLVDVQGSVNGFDVRTISRFIPAQAPENLRNWLSQALLSGKANDVTMRIKGDLDRFPFNQQDTKGSEKGEFWVKGNIAAGKLNFLPGVFAKDGMSSFWPAIDNIKGHFVFDRARMDIYGDTATTNGVPVSKVKATIPDLLEHDPILQIDGMANGGLQQMVNYVKASPVDDWIGNFLHETTASNGNAQLNLKLRLPLNALVESKVNGILQLNGVDTTLQTDLPLLSGLNGRIEFNEFGVTLNNLKATALGGPVSGTGGTQKDGVIRIKLEGNASGEGIQKHFAGYEFAPLLDRLSGSSRYFAQINVKRRQTEVVIDSSLQGMSSHFPAPLNKLESDTLPLHLEIVPESNSDSIEQRDQIKLAFGNKLTAFYQRKKGLEKNAKWSVMRGNIAVNSMAQLPDSGLSLHIDAKSLNVDDWRRLVIFRSPHDRTKILDTKMSTDIMQYVDPSSISFIADEVLVFGKTIEKIVFGASSQTGTWQANIESKQASGYVTWNGLDGRQGAGHISAKLARLIIPKSAASDVGDLLEGKNTDKQIPSVEIHAEDFELFEKKFGRLELNANNMLTAQGREWQIDKLNVKNSDAELNATGKWVGRTNDSQTSLSYVLDVADAGKLLDRLNFSDVMRGGKGRVEGELQWRGLPFELDIPSMDGSLKLKITSGQFLKVDPSRSKLFSVLSLQSLLRRMTLDFRDVFSEGFAFDSIVGSSQIQHGIAKTDNLKLTSVNVNVLTEGSADIGKETQDVRVKIIYDPDVGAASVVVGFAVNPVIGLGTLLTQLLLRDPLKRALTDEYQLTGSWKDPIFTKLENKERQAIPEKQKSEKNRNDQLLPKPEIK